MSVSLMDGSQRFRGCFRFCYIDIRCFTFSYMVFLLVYESHACCSVVDDYDITCTTNCGFHRTISQTPAMVHDKVCRDTRNKRITVGPIV